MSPRRSACYAATMQNALKAHVRNGRLVLDEPTELPEGAEVTLLIADDDLSDEERRELHRSLRESIAQMHAGKLVDADDVLAKLRSRA